MLPFPFIASELIVFETTKEWTWTFFPISRLINIVCFFFLLCRNESHVGRWYVKNIKPTPTGEPQELKIKVRINANGVISLTSANLVEKKLKEDIPIDNGNGETNNMEVGQEVGVRKIRHFPNIDIYIFF